MKIWRNILCEISVQNTNNITRNQVVSAAATELEHRRRGWTTEEDKKMKIFNLPKVNKAFSNSWDFFKKCYGTDEWTSGMDYSLCYCLSKFNCELRNEEWNNENCKDCRLAFRCHWRTSSCNHREILITHHTSDQIDQTKQTNFDPKTVGVGGSDVSETVEKSNFLSLRMFICLNLKIYRLWPSACWAQICLKVSGHMTRGTWLKELVKCQCTMAQARN